MLEILGFIALVSIIFGISFTTALTGVIKVVCIIILCSVAIILISNMLKTKTGAAVVVIASVVAIIFGVMMINHKLDSSYCTGVKNTQMFVSCSLGAMDNHNDAVNRGWGYILVGSISGLLGVISYMGIKKTEEKR